MKKPKPIPSRRHRKPTFVVEPMEERLLLSANLYDANANVSGQIETQIEESFDQLGNLGDSLNSEFKDTLIPLIDESLADLVGANVGDFFNFAADSNTVANFFSGDLTPTSGELALAFETALTNFGLSGTVTDQSTANQLRLSFDFSSGVVTDTTNLRLGEAEEELNLKIEDGTQVNLSRSLDLTYLFLADLSGKNASAPDYGLGDERFKFDLGGAAGGYQFNADSLHTTTTDPLADFGVQIGVLGMRDSVGGSGAYAQAGAVFDLDVIGNFDFTKNDGNDGFLDLGEFESFETTDTWDSAYELNGAGSNTRFGFDVGVANPGGTSFIGGLEGVAGRVEFTDANPFDQSAPLVETDETLASFARLTSQDLLNMVGGVSGWAAALDASELFSDNLPFLELSQGDAYAFGEAFYEVFLSNLQDVEKVVTARNAPSTQRGGSPNPVDYTGSTKFALSVNGAIPTEIVIPA
ncbi:MAG: LEPR-XLL domain-containing protein, partial [Verrucomicrobiota bacterium]